MNTSDNAPSAGATTNVEPPGSVHAAATARGNDLRVTAADETLWRDSWSDDEEAADALAHLSAAVDVAFNPSDGDGWCWALLADSVLNAAAYIERQPCTCDPDDPAEEGPCDRCQALGRLADQRVDR